MEAISDLVQEAEQLLRESRELLVSVRDEDIPYMNECLRERNDWPRTVVVFYGVRQYPLEIPFSLN